MSSVILVTGFSDQWWKYHLDTDEQFLDENSDPLELLIQQETNLKNELMSW